MIKSKKPFYEVNREERFYCSLFTHSLLSSKGIREKFLKCIGLNSESNNFEVYVEPAPLRDYWHDLGCPKKYDEKTHQAREDVLKWLLSDSEIDKENLLSDKLFWTTSEDSKDSKYCFPGNWKTEFLKSLESLEEKSKEKLLMLKYAFKSTPDIMIVSDSHLILIEAKLESPETKYESLQISQTDIQKIPQTDIQKEIGKIITKLIPAFKDKEFKHLTLKVEGADITWEDINGWVSSASDEIDEFTLKSFKSLVSRY